MTMVKYSYTLNPETNLVERAIQETYPDLDILDRGLNVSRKTEVVLKGVKKAYEGQAEQPIVMIEEQWWEVQSEIQELESKLKEISKLRETKDEFGLELTEEQLSLNKEKLDTLLKDNSVETVEEFTSKLTEEISVLGDKRSLIEEGDGTEENKPHEWLMVYRGAKVPADAVQPERPQVEVSIPKDTTKKLIAHERNLKVRNIEDTVADLSKMNALLMSFVSIIYSSLDQATIDRIPAGEKAFIDYAVSNWKVTQTRGDRQLAEEGVALIDKLYSREVQIADIVDNLKSAI